MNVVLVGVAVAIVGFILYVLDRRSKQEPIDYSVGGKIGLLSGIVSSGITFVSTVDTPEVIETVKNVASEVSQDMFVGKPTF